MLNWVEVGYQSSRIGIQAQFCSKPYWLLRNQWKLSFQESSPTYVIRCGEFEIQLLLPRNPIGRSTTNEIRLFWITAVSSQFHVESSNSDSDLSKTYWLDTNQWKARFQESGLPRVTWSEEFESGRDQPQNPLLTDRKHESRQARGVLSHRYFRAEGSNLRPFCLRPA